MRTSIFIYVPEHVKEFMLNTFGTENYICPKLDSFLGRMLQLAAEKTNTVKLRPQKDIVPDGWVPLEIRIPKGLIDYNFSDYTIRNLGRVFAEFFKMALGFHSWGGKDYISVDQAITTRFLEKTGTRGHIDDNSARRMGVNIVSYFNENNRKQIKKTKLKSAKNF